MPLSKKKVILGIDPGIATTGFGLIDQRAGHWHMKEAGLIKTTPKQVLADRLQYIYDFVDKLLKKHQPDVLAIEQLFFCRNVKSALAVGLARGVIILASAQNKINLQEFTPLQIKQALCGYGQATKKQIQIMVKQRLLLEKIPKPDDLADALAIALTSAQTKNWR